MCVLASHSTITELRLLVDDVYEFGTNNHILGMVAEQFVVHGYLKSVCKSAQAVDFGYDLSWPKLPSLYKSSRELYPLLKDLEPGCGAQSVLVSGILAC